MVAPSATVSRASREEQSREAPRRGGSRGHCHGQRLPGVIAKGNGRMDNVALPLPLPLPDGIARADFQYSTLDNSFL